MTNNKQQTAVDILCGKLAMKLGIPQAITFYIDHQEEIREAKEMEKEQKRIELPSDEEIKKMMELDGMEFDEFDPYDVSYLGGATWMRNKIQGGKQ